MSDHWEFFPCTIGEQRGSIFYDHGIRQSIDDMALPNVVKVRVQIKKPNDSGLPQQTEFDELTALEEAFSKAIAELGGIYVGRVTTDGCRYFTYYTGSSEAEAEKAFGAAGKGSGYSIGLYAEPDPEKKEYWQNLFPSDEDWQIIMDLRVIAQLKKHDDPCKSSRRIDHWASFNQADLRDQFVLWLETNEYLIQDKIEPGMEVKVASGEKEVVQRYGVQFFNVTVPVLEEVSRHTIALMRQTRKLGGSYDGWETSVESATPNPKSTP